MLIQTPEIRRLCEERSDAVIPFIGIDGHAPLASLAMTT